MKKRASTRSKRRLSTSRKSVSKAEISWLDRIRDTVARRREFVFVLLVLVAGMLIFDVIGYDYTGLVAENNAVTGAQNVNVDNVGDSLLIIPNLLYQFMRPLSYLFTGDNFVNTWRLIFALLLFFIISPILSKMTAIGERNGKIIAVILALAFGALFPGSVIEALLGSDGAVIQIILLIVYGAIVFYLGRLLYKKTHESDRVGRVLIAVFAIIFLLLILFFSSIFGTVITDDSLKGIFGIILGIGLLSQVIIGGWAVFLSTTPTSKDMERIGKRDEDSEVAREFKRGREERDDTTKEEEKARNRTVVLNRIQAADRAQTRLFRDAITALRMRLRTQITITAPLTNLVRSFADEETDLNKMEARETMNRNAPAGRASIINAYDDLISFNARFIGILRRQMNITRIGVLATDDTQAADVANILDGAMRQKKALLSRLR